MEPEYWKAKCRACGWRGSSDNIHANSKDDFMHCPHCASILIEEADEECDVPPLGWRCTRGKGHEGPCAAVECPEDIALVERGMKRLRTTRAELTKKHGTPPEFAAAVYRTVPEFLSMDEARDAVDRYAKEWFECGDAAPNAEIAGG